ncbi:MAG: DUF3788 family protein [Bacteroidales bacterium]|nr:DUF3788 family protein [Bacteroidales bacterium]
MSEKENLVLSDKQIAPTDDYIFSIIGEKRILWQSIMNYASENYKDISGSWNYYNDGKQWLFKLLQKKKTILWAGILKDTFRITFWFGDKTEPLIKSSDLPQTIKDDFKTAKKYGSIRSVSIKMNDQSDVDNVLKLIAIKHKMK